VGLAASLPADRHLHSGVGVPEIRPATPAAAGKSRAVSASETYHGPRSRRCAAARERYHKLSGVGLTRLPNVTNAADVTAPACWDSRD